MSPAAPSPEAQRANPLGGVPERGRGTRAGKPLLENLSPATSRYSSGSFLQNAAAHGKRGASAAPPRPLLSASPRLACERPGAGPWSGQRRRRAGPRVVSLTGSCAKGSGKVWGADHATNVTDLMMLAAWSCSYGDCAVYPTRCQPCFVSGNAMSRVCLTAAVRDQE